MQMVRINLQGGAMSGKTLHELQQLVSMGLIKFSNDSQGRYIVITFMHNSETQKIHYKYADSAVRHIMAGAISMKLRYQEILNTISEQL